MKRLFGIMFVCMLCVALGVLVNGETARAESGTCGDNLRWELDDEGLLTISGTEKSSTMEVLIMRHEQGRLTLTV